MYDEIFTNTIFKKRFTAIVRPRGKNFIYQTGYVGCIFQKIHDFYFSEIHIQRFSLIKPLILGQKMILASVRLQGKNFIYQTGYVGRILQKIHDF